MENYDDQQLSFGSCVPHDRRYLEEIYAVDGPAAD